MLRTVLRLAACVLVADGASASDGVLEINQTCATTTGCFPGDTPGFPITISAPGSYALTSNLTVSASGLDGIWIQTSPVTIDLGGFVLAGPVSCTGSGAGVTCTGVAGAGILATFNARVRDGTVTGFSAGIAANGSANAIFVDRVLANKNQGPGIWAGWGSRVADSSAVENGGDGIQLSRGILENCTSRGNHGAGIYANESSTILESSVLSNGLRGIDALDGVVIRDNVVRGNGGIGIFARSSSVSQDTGAVVASNLVHGNAADGIAVWGGSLVIDNTVTGNAAAGIAALAASSVQRNIVRQNSGIGMYLFPEQGGTAAVYRDNVVSANTGGTVTNGINLGSNSCNGTTTCP